VVAQSTDWLSRVIEALLFATPPAGQGGHFRLSWRGVQP
jgi:hypothetical protein